MVKKKNKYYKHPQAIVESKDVGDKTRIWAFTHVCGDVHVGKDCNIGEGCYIESKVALGDRVTVKNGVSLWAGVTTEDEVFIGPNAVFTNDLFPRSKKAYKVTKTLLKQGATIGANATIVCGITIGRYAMVGAGAVVTKDVPDYGLVYGNPAALKGYICECGKVLKVIMKKTRCACGERYIIDNKEKLRLKTHKKQLG